MRRKNYSRETSSRQRLCVQMTDTETSNCRKKEANEVLAWDKLREMMEQQTVVTVRIKESVPSGVVAFLEGIRAFIPASQLSADYVEDTDAWIGKDVRVVVITVDPEKNKLVLSGKVVARQEREEERNHRIAMLVPGSVVEGTVESIMPYGAFINIGNGISGLVHISQISQKRISSVHEVLKEGQKVKAKIFKYQRWKSQPEHESAGRYYGKGRRRKKRQRQSSTAQMKRLEQVLEIFFPDSNYNQIFFRQ